MKLFRLSLLTVMLLSGFWMRADHLSTQLLFTARMSGAQEVPEVLTDAQGLGMFSLDAGQTTLHINVSLNALSGPLTGIHIHEAAAGENGPVIIDLTGFLSGNRLQASLPVTRDQVAKMLEGQYYLNAHTAGNPGGEIRGQIRLETDYRYAARLSGDDEVPAVATAGVGVGIFHVNYAKNLMRIEVLFTGLTGEVTGAHIHNAPAGTNGGVIFDLTSGINGNTISAEWDPTAFLAELEAGDLYINVHTTDHPGGEIRGQIRLMPGLTFDARMSGAMEVPATVTAGRGLGLITVNPDLTEIAYYMVYDSMTGPLTGAHLHGGALGMNGGVVVHLTDDISGAVIAGTQNLNDALLRQMLAGGIYVNLHTEEYPGGEIRGQVYRFSREPYLFEMNGGQEVPPLTVSGTGAGMVSIDRDQTNAHYMMVVSDLTGPITGAHFHQGRPGMNGGVIFDLTGSFNDQGGAYGFWDGSGIVAFDAAPFRNGEVYVNVHTENNPGGEIRGNVTRQRALLMPLPVDPGFGDNLILTGLLSGDNEEPAVETDAIGLATLYFSSDRSTAWINVTATGLSGPIIGAHIHEGDPGTNGPVMFPLEVNGNRIQMQITDIDAFQLTSLLTGSTYVNIHTDENPGGEIRAQLSVDQDLTFYSLLNGDAEVPPVATTGQGLASFHLNLGLTSLEVNAQLTGLSSPIIGVHLHTGSADENGPVAIDLGGLRNGNTLRGTVELPIQSLFDLLLGNMYINVHTENNPDGEIREQLTYLPGITFDGWLSGNQEVPVATTAGTGLAVMTSYPGPDDILLLMLADGLTGPLQAAHLHRAPIGENGPVVHNLTGDLTENSILHLGLLNDGVFSGLLTSEIYLNVHSAAFPGGELRGQLLRRAREGYGFDLCTDQEVGAVDAPNATGSGLVSFDRDKTNANVLVLADGLTGAIEGAHFHGGAQGENGGVIYDLTDYIDGNLVGFFALPMDTGVIATIRDGQAYVNLHTAAHPAGELRGQVVMEFLCTIVSSVDPLGDVLEEVAIGPVPVTDQLFVSMTASTTASLQLHIVDVTGRVLTTEKIDVLSGQTHTTQLATAQLPAGFYTLMVTNGQAAQAYKFVK